MDTGRLGVEQCTPQPLLQLQLQAQQPRRQRDRWVRRCLQLPQRPFQRLTARRTGRQPAPSLGSVDALMASLPQLSLVAVAAAAIVAAVVVAAAALLELVSGQLQLVHPLATIQ